MLAALVDYLAMFYQSGNVVQMEVIARSMLAAMPEDIVALQFLGLALYQRGRIEDAYQTFKQVAAKQDAPERWEGGSACEPASVAALRTATRAYSGLADGWVRIAQILNRFGLHKAANRASEAAQAAGGISGGGAGDRPDNLATRRQY